MPRSSRRRVVARSTHTVLLAVAGLLAVTAASVNSNITRSNALAAVPAVPKLTQDTNILVMGLDSRVNEQGRPLSPAIYNALDAGDQSPGGGLTPSSSPSATPQNVAPATAKAPTTTTTYADWTGALEGGSIPCVK